MARKPTYSLKHGQRERTPEEHRRILEVLDEIQKTKGLAGQKLSKKRIYNTFGVSQTEFKSKSKPKVKKKTRIHTVERHCGK